MATSAKRHHVQGYENFLSLVQTLDTKKPTFVLFTGSKDAATGHSWCPDCVVADPFIEAAAIPAESNFVVVEVGDRSFWKDPKCIFRTDKDIFISVIPTLVRWKGPQRLEGPQCANSDLLDMFFNDD